MAQLNSRGTQTRNRWDYFEHSNGFAFTYGSVQSGPIGAYFANNSTGATAIDVYSLFWATSIAVPFEVLLFSPPLIVTPVIPTQAVVHAVQIDHAAPPGTTGMYSFASGAFIGVARYSSSITGATLAPIMGSYFTTLPPGWAIAVECDAQPNPCELSITVWYQYVTDNISPAQ